MTPRESALVRSRPDYLTPTCIHRSSGDVTHTVAAVLATSPLLQIRSEIALAGPRMGRVKLCVRLCPKTDRGFGADRCQRPVRSVQTEPSRHPGAKAGEWVQDEHPGRTTSSAYGMLLEQSAVRPRLRSMTEGWSSWRPEQRGGSRLRWIGWKPVSPRAQRYSTTAKATHSRKRAPDEGRERLGQGQV